VPDLAPLPLVLLLLLLALPCRSIRTRSWWWNWRLGWPLPVLDRLEQRLCTLLSNLFCKFAADNLVVALANRLGAPAWWYKEGGTHQVGLQDAGSSFLIYRQGTCLLCWCRSLYGLDLGKVLLDALEFGEDGMIHCISALQL
jgi:hypothetical protein